MSRELGDYTGSDVGLQGLIVPAFISPASERLRFYFVALTVVLLVYLLYKRFVDSPTGRVCVAIRENEGRAKMLSYNTFTFKLAALTLSSLTAALAGLPHALYQPIVSPNVADLGFTVIALLDHPDWRSRHVERRPRWRGGLSPARFWSAALHRRKCQLHQRGNLCSFCAVHPVWHRRHMEVEIV